MKHILTLLLLLTFGIQIEIKTLKNTKLHFFNQEVLASPHEDKSRCGILNTAIETMEEEENTARQLVRHYESKRQKLKRKCGWRNPWACVRALFASNKKRKHVKQINHITGGRGAAERQKEQADCTDEENEDPDIDPTNTDPRDPADAKEDPLLSNQEEEDRKFFRDLENTGAVKINRKTGDITFFTKGRGKGGVKFKGGNLNNPKLLKKLGLKDEQIKDIQQEYSSLDGFLDLDGDINQKNKNSLNSKSSKTKELNASNFLSGGYSTSGGYSKNDPLYNKKGKLPSLNSKKKKNKFKSLFRKGFKRKRKGTKSSDLLDEEEMIYYGNSKIGTAGISLFLRIHRRYRILDEKKYFL